MLRPSRLSGRRSPCAEAVRRPARWLSASRRGPGSSRPPGPGGARLPSPLSALSAPAATGSRRDRPGAASRGSATRSRARRCRARRTAPDASGRASALAAPVALTRSPGPGPRADGGRFAPATAACRRRAAVLPLAPGSGRETLPHPPQVLQLATGADLPLEDRRARILPARRHVDPVLEAALDRQVRRFDAALHGGRVAVVDSDVPGLHVREVPLDDRAVTVQRFGCEAGAQVVEEDLHDLAVAAGRPVLLAQQVRAHHLERLLGALAWRDVGADRHAVELFQRHAGGAQLLVERDHAVLE